MSKNKYVIYLQAKCVLFLGCKSNNNLYLKISKLSLKILLGSIGLFSLTSCSNSLNRSNAKIAIVDFINSKNDTNLLSKRMKLEGLVQGQGEKYRNDLDILRPYINGGLISLKQKEVRPNTYWRYWYIYSITPKGKPFILSEEWDSGYPTYYVKTYDLFVDEITGIKFSPDNKQAVVEFFLSKENISPFGLISSNPDDKVLLKALFTLYDDGWRIEQIKYQDH